MTNSFCFSAPLLRRYFFGILFFEVLLVALHFGFGDLRFFNLDREYNFPSWFSGIQLAVIGVVCIIPFHTESQNLPFRCIWFILASGFFYLSFDEIMAVHESFLRQEALDMVPGTSLLRGLPPWQIVFAPFAIITAIVFALFFKPRFIPKSTAWYFLIGGFACWGLAFVFEGTAMSFFIPNGWYQQEVALEEFSEMAGATLILNAIVQYSFLSNQQNVETENKGVPNKSLAWAMPVLLLIVLPMGLIMLVNSQEKQSVHISSSNRLLKAEKYEEAVKVLTLVLENYGDNIKTLKLMATAAFKSGDFELAEKTYLRALSIDPDDKIIRNGLSLLKLKKRLAKKSKTH